MKTFKALGFVLLLAIPTVSFGQKPESVDTTLVNKIKDEGMNRSQVMSLLNMITDANGPRLTNSPGYKKAADKAKASLESFGLQNVHFDNWGEDFGRGWQLKKFSLQALEPISYPVIAYPKAWSPGIAKGPVQTEAIYLDVKNEADLTKYAGKLKGKIILFNDLFDVKQSFKADARRFNDSTLLQMANADVAEPFNMNAFRGRQRNPTFLAAQKLSYAKWDFCMKEGAIAVLEGSAGGRFKDGTVVMGGATVPYPADVPFDKRVSSYSATVPKILPQILVSDEIYDRLVRQAQSGPLKMELALETEFTPAAPGFNIIAEIPGTDLKDEVVMIGAHFDSWHGATGTTDNGCGSAVMMETMRILKTLGISPRRTIRIGLWGGEEQGLIGSRSYVKRILGERLDKTRPYDSIKLTPAGEKFSVYFNMDNGTGRYRGIYLQGNENVGNIFRTWLKPFNKMGASTLTLDNTGGTDHLSFDAINLPGFQFIQDEIDYDTRTHHTNMDLYDKAIEADMKQNSVMTAVFTWLAANRDEKIPRK